MQEMISMMNNVKDEVKNSQFQLVGKIVILRRIMYF